MRKSTLSLVAGAIGALTLLAPQPVAAQTITLCSVSLTRACYGIALMPYSPPGSDAGGFVFKFQNLTGSWTGTEISPATHAYMVIGTQYVGEFGTISYPVHQFLEGTATIGGTFPPTDPLDVWPHTTYGGFDFIQHFWGPGGDEFPMPGFGGLYGCAFPTDTDAPAWGSTCARKTGDVWFVTEVPQPGADLSIPLTFTVMADQGRADAGCHFSWAATGPSAGYRSEDCTIVPYISFTTTPEPATLALLGTGLLGLGGFAATRRRRS